MNSVSRFKRLAFLCFSRVIYVVAQTGTLPAYPFTNLISPKITVQVRPGQSGYIYAYTLENEQNAVQSIY